jgi:hypothetical protein
MRGLSVIVALSASVLLTGCFEGSQGPAGPSGPQGVAGLPGRKENQDSRGPRVRKACAGSRELPARPAPKARRVLQGQRVLRDLPGRRDRPDRRRRQARFVMSKPPATSSPAVTARCWYPRSARKAPRPCREPEPNVAPRPAQLGSACENSELAAA